MTDHTASAQVGALDLDTQARARELAARSCQSTEPCFCHEYCEQIAAAIAAALDEALRAGEIAGLLRAIKLVNERASDYARLANSHDGEELGVVYTDKCGVCASIASRIDARISELTAPPAEKDELE